MFVFPADEFARLQILPEFEIVDASGEAEFDDIVHLASETLGLPFAAFTIVGVTELTMVATAGVPSASVPRDMAVCSYTILSDDVTVVPDLTQDDRFRAIPNVAGGDAIISYAGAPVVSREGVRLGALCVMGPEPRDLAASDRRILRRLAGIVSDRLESRRQRLRVHADIAHRLRETEQLCQTTLNLANLVPWKSDARGRLVSVGDNWSVLTGSADTAMVTSSWINFVHPDDVEDFCNLWRVAINEGVAFETEMRLQRVSGPPIWCRVRSTPAQDACGRIVGWYGLIADIEEERKAKAMLKTMEAQLGHMSRLNAMETMASTLAHELNQPLAAITQYVRGSQRLLARLDDPAAGPVLEALDEAAAGALRAGGIVRSLRELVARGEVQRRREPLDALIGDAVRAAFGGGQEVGVDCRVDVEPGGLLVMVDGIQIQQVLLNLIRNAMQALWDAPEQLIVISAERSSDEECAVTVRDTGSGIPIDVATRLFTPFNTSKADGMGIGLSISRTIIEAHGGQISAAAAPGGGTIFRFTLPLG